MPSMATAPRVLVAGSDECICGSICEGLAGAAEVRRAGPEEAASLVMKESFDVVFACGLRCAQRLAQLTAGRPVRVVGVPDEGEEAFVRELGALRAAYLYVGASGFLPVHPAFDSHSFLELARGAAFGHE